MTTMIVSSNYNKDGSPLSKDELNKKDKTTIELRSNAYFYISSRNNGACFSLNESSLRDAIDKIKKITPSGDVLILDDISSTNTKKKKFHR